MEVIFFGAMLFEGDGKGERVEKRRMVAAATSEADEEDAEKEEEEALKLVNGDEKFELMRKGCVSPVANVQRRAITRSFSA